MTIFICEKCGLEMDFDKDVNELIECWDCNGIMYGIEEDEL